MSNTFIICLAFFVASVSSACVDLTNPSTGISDCPYRRAYCTQAVWYNVMRVQCPKTCGFCSTTSTTTRSSTTCRDLTNPSTGISDCPNRRSYCTQSIWYSVMRTQCPRTCGFC